MIKQQSVISIFFVALLLFVLYSAALMLLPFLQPIFWAAVAAYGFYPIYQNMLKLCRGHRNLAALLTTGFLILIFLPILVVVLAGLAHEISAVSTWIFESLRNGKFEAFLDSLKNMPHVQKVLHSSLFQNDLFKENLEGWLSALGDNLGRLALAQIANITKNALITIVNLFLTIFLIFFFFRDGEKMYRFIYGVTPLKSHIKEAVYAQIGDTFSAVLRGQLFTAVAQATCLGITFWALRLPLPLFFAAAAFLAALIPVVGAAIIWVPFVGYLAVLGQYTQAGILLFLGTFVISGVDNVLKPFLIGNKTKLPYILLFLGILGGMQVYGLMGIFVAPAVLSLFFVLIKIYREEILEEKS